MITHHPARYQFDLLHLRVFINRAKIEVMHLFIEMATREYFLFEIVHRCEINGKGEETTRILGGRFLRAFSKKKKKKGRTAHFLHANDDNCFPLCDYIFDSLYILFKRTKSEQKDNRKMSPPLSTRLQVQISFSVTMNTDHTCAFDRKRLSF